MLDVVQNIVKTSMKVMVLELRKRRKDSTVFCTHEHNKRTKGNALLLFRLERSKKVYKRGKSLTNQSSNINHLVCGLKTRKLKDNKEKFIQ